MDELNTIIYTALNNYFSALKKTGYLSSDKCNQLLLLVFISYVLNEFNGLFTAKEYAELDRLITCIQSSNCLVPYTKLILLSEALFKGLPTDKVDNYLVNMPTLTSEDDETRYAEDTSARLQS